MIGLFGKNDWIFQIMYTIYSIFIRGWIFSDNNLKSNYGLSREMKRAQKKTERERKSMIVVRCDDERVWNVYSMSVAPKIPANTKISQTNKVHES